MSFGAMCNYADSVEEEFVKEICPDEFKAFIDSCNAGDEVSTVAMYLDRNSGWEEIDCVTDNEEEEIRRLYAILQKVFKEKTGLDLFIRYVDNGGSSYDDVDGVFWEVDNVYQLTEAAKKLENQIRRNHWITYG